jgi:hypothetical protein
LLSADQKIRIRREAVEWLIAWQKTMENNNWAEQEEEP